MLINFNLHTIDYIFVVWYTLYHYKHKRRKCVMKKQLFKNGIVSLILCCTLLFSGTTIYADIPESQTEDFSFQGEGIESTETDTSTKSLDAVTEDIAITGENDVANISEEITGIESTENSTSEETSCADTINIIGLEDVSIKEISDITFARTRNSCGGNHTWETISVIQEGNCEREWIYKIRCTVCSATATAYTDAPGHDYVEGACIICGEIEVAPDEELSKWEYTLNDTDGTITLKQYISDLPDVIIYGRYNVDGKIYSTLFNGSRNRAPFYNKEENITSIIIKKGVSSTDCYNIFGSCTSLKLLDIKNFDTSQVTNMSYMFALCNSITNLDLVNLNTSQVTDMSYMFTDCTSITDFDLVNFNTSNVTNMNGMFLSCYALKSINLKNFDTSNVTNMGGMFMWCTSLAELDLTGFDTSNVTNMRLMFAYDNNLANLYLDNFDTSKVTDMHYMFNSCSLLKSLNVSSFDTSNVTNMDSMFANCRNLTVLDLSNFNTSKVTDMHGMFANCYKFTNLNLSNFDTSNVTNMSTMFYGCSNLSSLNIKRFDTSKVTGGSNHESISGQVGMSMMFRGCSNLVNLNLYSFKTSDVTTMYQMFMDCPNLVNIYADEEYWDTSNADTTDMFKNCGTQSVTKI